MKFYETHYDEYISSVERYNLHPELLEIYPFFPQTIQQFENLIIFGSSGIGKYSQVLYFLKKYSPTELKYEKKLTVQNEKQTYKYRISDIHYEIDMSFLGCNSKILWHEIFFQIVEIISVKQEKIGIIVCKNFHMIHSELLDNFYSYIQQYNSSYMNIQIKFILITEHISFIPTNILNSFEILPIKRPTNTQYTKLYDDLLPKPEHIENDFIQRISNIRNIQSNKIESSTKIVKEIDTNTLINIKETRSFSLLNSADEIPADIFNIICNQIISEITNHTKLNFANFRDSLYDILIYNLDVTECVWYILSNFINNKVIKQTDISDVLAKTYSFLKYYNNNYRPIYHLESIMFYLIIKIHGYEIGKNDKKKGICHIRNI